METLEALRRRIATTTELASVVRTMKTLSAVSIRQAERAVGSIRDYARNVELGLHVALRDHDVPVRPVVGRPGRTAAVVFGSDVGLCGRFNDEIAAFALDRLAPEEPELGEPLLAAVGARVGARLRALARPADTALDCPASVAGLEASVREILLQVDRWRSHEPVTRVLLFHHGHRATGAARLRTAQLLPVDLDRLREPPGGAWPSRRLPIFRMDRDALRSALLRQYLFVGVFRALTESLASEHALRVQTMQVAERNLEDRLAELRADFHRLRQDAITAELLDIVAGYEAVVPEASR